MIRTLETARLLLRPLELADAEQTQRMFPQLAVVEYLAHHVPWPYPPDGALVFYRDRALPAMERGEEWHWTIRLKTAPTQIIGSIGLTKGEGDNRGFWLDPAWHGQGLMTEAAAAATEFWFADLGFERLRVAKAVPNTASRRVSEKGGMRVVSVDERDYVSGRYATEIWEITREEWLRRRSVRTESAS
jgi:ribosomal-protein-alanine N-acetyltransferase